MEVKKQFTSIEIIGSFVYIMISRTYELTEKILYFTGVFHPCHISKVFLETVSKVVSVDKGDLIGNKGELKQASYAENIETTTDEIAE